MEQYDAQLAQRVWQRVRGETVGAQGNVKGLLLAEAEAGAVYRQLSRAYPEQKRLWQRLAGENRRHMAYLRGILYLTEGHRGDEIPIKPRPEQPEALLRLCCAQCLKLEGQYRELSDDPEYGCIYEMLAAGKRAQFAAVLESIGAMGK